ncbi:tape measure protein [Streptococcus sp. S2(2023)]|uniref:Tape measure protein n=1 Tax=Streptococcus gingivalis TaxID=3111861 RepID=A0ABU6BAE5_9STRE|nr:tape measure protein [Streptococcus sp. S2(2023)]MEB3520637.1 tape measure protein [Streptococcus sp. S2(2023)]
MADGKIVIDVQVNGRKLTELSDALKRLESEARRSGQGVKSAGDGIQATGDKALRAGQGFKRAGDRMAEGAKLSETSSNGFRRAGEKIKESSDLAGRSGSGFKQAGEKVKESSDLAQRSGDGFKQAAEKVKASGNEAKTGGEGFKSASFKIKEAGALSKSGGDAFKQAAEKVREAGTISKTGGNGFKVSADLAHRAGQVASQSGGGFVKLKDIIKTTGDQAEKSASKFDKIKDAIKNFSVGAVAFKAVSSAMNLVSQSMDKAIDRFDTLQRFPKVMKSLGHSSKDVAASTKLLSEGIEGLPTTLDTVVSTTQKLTSMTGNLKQSTKLTIALNNAFLASGASTEDASRGLQQYTQMLSAGKVDMQSWKTLQETMPYALQKTAESFGFAGASAQKDFYSALQDGKITFTDFSKRLIELNKGTNGFAEMAKKNSEGIKTSFGNIVNAVAKGIANVIAEFDKMSKAVTGKSIAQNLDSIKGAVNSTFNVIISVIRGATPVIKSLVSVLGFLKPVLDPLISVFAGVAGAVLLFKGAMLGLSIIKGIGSLIGTLITSLVSLTSTSLIAQGATTGLAGALASLSSGGVFLVVGAIAGLVSWLTRESEEVKKAKAENEEFKRSIDDLHDSVSKGNEAYKDRRNEIKATAEDNERLVKKIDELNAVENKTAAQKKELASAAEILNSRIDGLNLVYDKATGTINMTTDAIRKQIEISKQSAEAEAAQQRLVEIAKKRLEIEDKEAEVKKKHAQAIEEVDAKETHLGLTWAENSLKAGMRKKIDEEAAEASKKLQDAKAQLGEQEQRLTGIIQNSLEAQAKATEDSAGRQILTLQTMDETQKKLVDDMKAQYEALRGEVQNAFQAIEQQTALSADQMTANLQKNIDAVDKWSQNLETLAKRGLDQGLIEQMRQAGPKMADQTQALVNASDEQLGALNTKWTEAGDKAKEGFLRGIRATGVELAPEVQAMVTAIGDEFRQALIDAGFDVKAREIPQKVGEGIEANKGAAAQAVNGMTESAKQAFNNLPTEAKYSGSQVSGGYAQGITDNQGSVQGAVDGLKNASLGVLANLFGEGQAKGAELGAGVGDGVLSRSDVVQGAASTLKSNATATMDGMASDGQAKGSEFGSGIALGIGVGQQVAVGAASVMNLAISAQFLAMSMNGQQYGSQFGTGIGGGINSSQGIATGASNAMKMMINASVNSLGHDGRNAGSQFGTGVTSGIASQNGAVHGASSALKSSAHSGMSGGYSGGYSAGTAIGEGMMSGIYAMAGSVAAAAASIASSAVAAARSTLRINSPSKVFRDQVGRAIPEGMAVGIEKYGYYVDDSMTDLANKTVESGKKYTDGFGFNLPGRGDLVSGLTDTLATRFGYAGGGSSSSNVTNNYTLNANGTANDNFFSPENMRRLLRELAYYTNLEGGRMA